jgi:hypothetical protein
MGTGALRTARMRRSSLRAHPTALTPAPARTTTAQPRSGSVTLGLSSRGESFARMASVGMADPAVAGPISRAALTTPFRSRAARNASTVPGPPKSRACICKHMKCVHRLCVALVHGLTALAQCTTAVSNSRSVPRLRADRHDTEPQQQPAMGSTSEPDVHRLSSPQVVVDRCNVNGAFYPYLLPLNEGSFSGNWQDTGVLVRHCAKSMLLLVGEHDAGGSRAVRTPPTRRSGLMMQG